MNDENKLAQVNHPITIFSEAFNKEREQAIQNFFTGSTPTREVRKRQGRGGGQQDYINGYWMFGQMSLITNFRWSHNRLNIKYRPTEENPIEIIIDVVVTIWDEQGNQYSHTATGSKDVARYGENVYLKKNNLFIKDDKGEYVILHNKGDIISLGDDIKSAETDAMKKALSYFGIARDVYGHKSLSVIDETTGEEDPEEKKKREDVEEFKRIMTHLKLRWSQVFEILGVSNVSQIEDWKEALNKIEKWNNEKEKEV